MQSLAGWLPIADPAFIGANRVADVHVTGAVAHVYLGESEEWVLRIIRKDTARAQRVVFSPNRLRVVIHSALRLVAAGLSRPACAPARECDEGLACGLRFHEESVLCSVKAGRFAAGSNRVPGVCERAERRQALVLRFRGRRLHRLATTHDEQNGNDVRIHSSHIYLPYRD